LTPLYNLQLRKRTCKTPIINYKLVIINISIILAIGFNLNYQDLGATLFSITFKEIDYEI
jgi:hypothetical protein